MQSQIPQLPYIEMTTSQYAKDQDISEATVRRMCESGTLDAYQISEGLKGSPWRIKVPRGDVVPRVEYDRVVKENTELHTIINAFRKLLPPA